jgi:outer membrane protein assembly factor BamB
MLIFRSKFIIRYKTNLILYGILLLVLGLPAYGQTERWVFVYNGPGSGYDVAKSLVYGADSNIYVAGYSWGIEGNSDFIVISLNKDTGDTNWIYRYNGPGDGADVAKSLVCGADNNIYAAGYSTGNGTSTDFTVISLNKDTGDTNWVYRYNGPGNGGDGASSIVYGADGNLYAAGSSRGDSTYADFTVISLTSTGGERWVYQYDDPDHKLDWANSIVYGADSNLYAAGEIGCGDTINNEYSNLGVISLTSSGSERWVYVDSSISPDATEEAYSIVYGADGNLYVAGRFSNYYDIRIVSLTALGDERWRYSYAGPPGSSGDDLDEIRAIVYGADGNIYAAGVSDSTDWTNPTDAFTVISLTPAGSERWVYRYYSGVFDWANSIVYGADSNLYAVGMCFQGTWAFGVISLTPAGGERWIYRYNSSGIEDEAYSIIFGADGNLYACGYAGYDLVVVSLTPAGAVAEHRSLAVNKNFGIFASTFQTKHLEFILTLSEPNNIFLSLYDISGQKVQSWHVSVPEGSSKYKWDLGILSAGVYILKAETEKKHSEGKKIIIVK